MKNVWKIAVLIMANGAKEQVPKSGIPGYAS